VVARILRRGGDVAVLADALSDPDVCRALLDVVADPPGLKGTNGGRLTGRPTPALRAALEADESPSPRPSGPSRATRP